MTNENEIERQKSTDPSHPYPKEFAKTGRPYISPNQLIRLLRCPKSYYAYYILDKSDPPDLKLQQGDFIHDALCEAIKQGIFNGDEETAKQSCRADVANRIGTWIDDGEHEDYSDGDNLADPDFRLEWKTLIRDGMGEAVEAFYKLNVTECIPEEPLKIPYDPNVDLFGITDLIAQQGDNGDNFIIDWKTTGRKPSSPKRHHVYQVGKYGIMAEAKTGLTFHKLKIPYIVMRNSGTTDHIIHTIDFTDEFKETVWNQTELAIQRLRRFHKTGEWPALPITADWYCGYCPHRDDCVVGPEKWN